MSKLTFIDDPQVGMHATSQRRALRAVVNGPSDHGTRKLNQRTSLAGHRHGKKRPVVEAILRVLRPGQH